MCKDPDVYILETVSDRVHRIGETYIDKRAKNSYKSATVRFSTFRHRSIMYRAKRNKKKNFRVKLGLAKKRPNLLVSANKLVSNSE